LSAAWIDQDWTESFGAHAVTSATASA